jgi:hypothetical protein
MGYADGDEGSAMNEEAQGILKQWTDKFETKEVPVTSLIWGAPLYALKTLTERVEPYWSKYTDLYHTIGETLSTDENGDWELPSENYWKPTGPMRDMLRRLEAYRVQAWRVVPNPDYDPVRAAEWEGQRRKPFDQTKITIGQSYHPSVSTPPPNE